MHLGPSPCWMMVENICLTGSFSTVRPANSQACGDTLTSELWKLIPVLCVPHHDPHFTRCPIYSYYTKETTRLGAPQSRRWPLIRTWTLCQLVQLASEENLRVGMLPPLWNMADPSGRMWRRSGSEETSETDRDGRGIRAEYRLCPQFTSTSELLTEAHGQKLLFCFDSI